MCSARAAARLLAGSQVLDYIQEALHDRLPAAGQLTAAFAMAAMAAADGRDALLATLGPRASAGQGPLGLVFPEDPAGAADAIAAAASRVATDLEVDLREDAGGPQDRQATRWAARCARDVSEYLAGPVRK
jgi:hypothetical protein